MAVRRRLITPYLLGAFLLIYLGIMAYVGLHITNKGIVYNLGKTCEEAVELAVSDKDLMDETYRKIIRFPELCKKYGCKSLLVNDFTEPKIYKELDLNWDKLFSNSFDNDILYDYKKKYTHQEIMKGHIALGMIDSIKLFSNSCYYKFTPKDDDKNKTSYDLSLNWREYSAKITDSGVEREYFLRFPW